MGFGDELMVTGHCRVLQQQNPRKVRLDYGKRLWNEVFDHNPRIALPEEQGSFQIYQPRINGLRPYCKRKHDTQWIWQNYKPEPGEIYFQPYETAFAERYEVDVVIEPNIKAGASPNKRWPPHKWIELARLILGMGYKVAQLGMPNSVMPIPGVQFIQTDSFRRACAVLSRAKAAVVHEGGMHHAAAALGVPAVVIYGGFISPAQTGYDMHRNIFTGAEPCGMRLRCRHCERSMELIKPAGVLSELMQILK